MVSLFNSYIAALKYIWFQPTAANLILWLFLIVLPVGSRCIAGDYWTAALAGLGFFLITPVFVAILAHMDQTKL